MKKFLTTLLPLILFLSFTSDLNAQEYRLTREQAESLAKEMREEEAQGKKELETLDLTGARLAKPQGKKELEPLNMGVTLAKKQPQRAKEPITDPINRRPNRLWYFLVGAIAISLSRYFSEKKPIRRYFAEKKRKKCPDCAELIKVEAKVCRYCGKKLKI